MVNIFLGIFLFYRPIVMDSSIYIYNKERSIMEVFNIRDKIIDYAIDDFFYGLTNRFLYKIDLKRCGSMDRVPLPERFHSCTTSANEVILITADEIVLIEKANLSFKGGIGLERGDYIPMRTRTPLIYLVSHSGQKSTIEILDLDLGRKVSMVTQSRIKAWDDADDGRLAVLDINHTITIYDSLLNKEREFHPQFQCQAFRRIRGGFIGYGQNGIYMLNQKGTVIESQPMPAIKNNDPSFPLVSTGDGLVYYDTLTLRVRGQSRLDNTVFRVIDQDGEHALVVDKGYQPYLIDLKTLSFLHLAVEGAKPEPSPSIPGHPDSVWFFQLGAFTNYDNAFEMYNLYISQRIPVFIDSGDLYRIRLGGFEDRQDALAMIENAGLTGWFVFHKRKEGTGRFDFTIDGEDYVLEQGIIRKERR
jgi:hypothetical protein